MAIDAEIERRVPPALARRYGAADFWRRWTRLECLAKLTDTPVVLLRAALAGTGDPDPRGVELTTLVLEPEPGTEVVVSVGRTATPTGGGRHIR